MSNHCHFNDSVLVLGCGNSRISEFLAPKVKSIKNVDISEQVIARMQEQYSDESYHENVRSMTCERWIGWHPLNDTCVRIQGAGRT